MSFYSTLEVADVAVTTRFVLVDKSGTAWPHTANQGVGVEGVTINLDREGTGDWVLRIGVVEKVDATNGSVNFFIVLQMRSGTFLNIYIPLHGKANRELTEDKVISSNDVSGSTNWQSDVTLANPTGSDVAPGAVDIVMELVELDGTAIISASVTVEYNSA